MDYNVISKLDKYRELLCMEKEEKGYFSVFTKKGNEKQLYMINIAIGTKMEIVISTSKEN